MRYLRAKSTPPLRSGVSRIAFVLVGKVTAKSRLVYEELRNVRYENLQRKRSAVIFKREGGFAGVFS